MGLSDPPAHRPVRVYSPAPLLLTPGRLFRDMLRDLWLSLGLAWQLAGRDIKAQYRQSLLGYFWAIVPPLLIALSFGLLHSSGVFSRVPEGVPYGAYVITGTLLWQVFSDAVATPLRMVSGGRDIFVRVNFPREALIVSGLLITGFGALVRLALMAAVILYYGIAPSPALALVPVGMLCLILAGTATGLLLTPAGVLYHDIEKALPPLLLLWMLLTPVAYPLGAAGSAPWWLAWNFVAPLIEATRHWSIGGGAASWGHLGAVAAGSLAVVFAGWLLLRLATPHLVARLGL